jgi:hypothetical protein
MENHSAIIMLILLYDGRIHAIYRATSPNVCNFLLVEDVAKR